MKPITHRRSHVYVFACLLLLAACLASCAPKVYSFNVHPCTHVVLADTVWFDWRVRGQASLLSYEESLDDDENPGSRQIVYKMVASSKKKQAFAPLITVTVLPESSVVHLLGNTIRHPDSAVVCFETDEAVWGTHFLITGIAAETKRSMTVVHAGKTVELDARGSNSSDLDGFSNTGPWEIRTALTPAEKNDSTLIPGKLRLKLTVKHQTH